MKDRIVYIEDQDEFREIMTTYLRWYGFYVEAFKDSDQAMRFLKDNAMDLVICDIYVSPLNGYEVCHAVFDLLPDSFKSIRFLLTGPEEPDIYTFMKLKRPRLFFMPKYQGAEKWFSKIATILQHRDSLS